MWLWVTQLQGIISTVLCPPSYDCGYSCSSCQRVWNILWHIGQTFWGYNSSTVVDGASTQIGINSLLQQWGLPDFVWMQSCTQKNCSSTSSFWIQSFVKSYRSKGLLKYILSKPFHLFYKTDHYRLPFLNKIMYLKIGGEVFLNSYCIF